MNPEYPVYIISKGRWESRLTSKALEIAKDINMVVFDKTGTLTKGEPVVTEIVSVDEKIDKKHILKIAGSIEKNSEHPLAQAIVNKAKEEKVLLSEVKDFKAIAGSGFRFILNLLINRNKNIISPTVNTHIHHAENINDNPSKSNLPKLELGDCIPSPKKFRARFIMRISGILAKV